MFEAGHLVALGVLSEVALQLALAALILLRQRGTPQVRLTWLIVVLTLPLVGLLFYLVIGEPRLGRRRVARHRRVGERVASRMKALEPKPVADPTLVIGRAGKVARLARIVGGTRPRPGNRLELYSETDHAIDSLIEDLRRARSSCHLLFYIWLPDTNGTRVGEALIEAAGRGVASRVLVDSFGSKQFLKSRLRRRLESAGVKVVEALPGGWIRSGLRRIDHRNHRKLAVIDGSIGWTGSQNLADAAFSLKPRYAPWVDLMVRIEGPAVSDLQALFVTDWLLECDEPMDGLVTPPPPSLVGGVPAQVIGTGPMGSNRGLRTLTQLGLLQANEEIVLTTPYLVPDDTTVATLRTAALAGAATSVVVPARNDSPLVAAASRSFYENLLEAGIAIYEFHAGLLHAKTLTVDGSISVVATANMDRRSYELNFEVSLIAFDRKFSRDLRAVQQSYIEDSERVVPEAWRQRGWPRTLWQNAAGILAPLL